MEKMRNLYLQIVENNNKLNNILLNNIVLLINQNEQIMKIKEKQKI